MAYIDDIDALNPDHLWGFDSNTTDSAGSLVGTLTSITYSPAIARDATECMRTNAVGDRFALPDTVSLQNDDHDRKTLAGWFQVNNIQLPPKTIYREGTNTTYLHFVMWAGNKILFDVVNSGGTKAQAISNMTFTPNRSYHICGKVEGTGQGNFIKLFIDGIEQDVTIPADGSFGDATILNRGVAEFGDASGSTSVGGGAVLLNAPLSGFYNYWASWVGANAQLTDDEIRTELFGKGAIASNEISSQANLDTHADSVIGDVPMAFNITGTTLDLDADNITFDERCSCHIRWEGTGVLNWTNTNGSNASTYVATNGGTVNILNPATLTIAGLIDGSEVRIYDYESYGDNNFDTELEGTESNTGTTYDFSHNGSVNTVVVQIIKVGYIEIIQEYSLGANDVTLTVFPEVESN